METQGQRIKKIRTALNMSQEDFGRIFDITKQYVSGLEKDKVFLNNEKIVKLLLDYNINANYLLAGVGMMFMNSEENNTDDITDIKQDILNDVRLMLKEEGLIK